MLSFGKDNAYSINCGFRLGIPCIGRGIRILISSFDDDDNNDGYGMADLTWDTYQFSSLDARTSLT